MMKSNNNNYGNYRFANKNNGYSKNYNCNNRSTFVRERVDNCKRFEVIKPVVVVEVPAVKLKTTSTTVKIVYSRDEMVKLINNKEMPKGIALDKSILSMDCIEINAIDLSWLINKDEWKNNKKHNSDSYKTNIDDGEKTKDFSWQLGSKITKLVHHENGYLPPKMRKAMNSNNESADLLVFERTIKAVLNKMTPENFDSCILEIMKLNIKTKDKLNCLVEQVFSKAILEESYSKIYSKFSSKFSGLNANGVNFRSALLAKCQLMFKTGFDKQIAEVKEFWREKISKEENERMKAMYEENIEDQINKVKDKYLGNITFISELTLLNEMPNKIILFCIKSFLNDNVNRSVSLEAVCKILAIVGKHLETHNCTEINDIFIKIKELSISKELETKIRFKLKDIIDMKIEIGN